MECCTWVAITRGDDIPKRAISSGRCPTDGEVYVGRSDGGGIGKINVQDGKMWNLWCHNGNASQHGEILIVQRHCRVQWVAVCKGSPLPKDAVHGGDTPSDGAVYPCRHAGGGAVGKLNLKDGKCHNMWFHGDWLAKSDGEVLVVAADQNKTRDKKSEQMSESKQNKSNRGGDTASSNSPSSKKGDRQSEKKSKAEDDAPQAHTADQSQKTRAEKKQKGVDTSSSPLSSSESEDDESEAADQNKKIRAKERKENQRQNYSEEDSSHDTDDSGSSDNSDSSASGSDASDSEDSDSSESGTGSDSDDDDEEVAQEKRKRLRNDRKRQ